MRRQELRHTVFVFFHQKGTGRIEQTSARLHIGTRGGEDFVLLAHTLFQLAFFQPPLGVRTPTPCAGPRAGRIHENEVHLIG